LGGGVGVLGWGVLPQTPNPQNPNPQSPIPNPHLIYIIKQVVKYKKLIILFK